MKTTTTTEETTIAFHHGRDGIAFQLRTVYGYSGEKYDYVSLFSGSWEPGRMLSEHKRGLDEAMREAGGK